jgi:hypothetical protein
MGVRADLAPQGGIEEALADQIALFLWRLPRVARYETAVINVSQEEVKGALKGLEDQLYESIGERDEAQFWGKISMQALTLLDSLATLGDCEKVDGEVVYEIFEAVRQKMDGKVRSMPDFVKMLCLPAEAQTDDYLWAGWTAAIVRHALRKLASVIGLSYEDLLAQRQKYHSEYAQHKENWCRMHQTGVDDLTLRIQEKESRLRRDRMLPDEKILTKIARYEGHLGKQLNQAFQEFRRFQQAHRDRADPPLPAEKAIIHESNPTAE